jgi:hypothetical protein
MVKQLPVEMLQQCSSVSSYVDTHCHGGALYCMSAYHASWMALHSFFSVSHYTSDVIVVPFCMNSAINTPFLSQKTVTINQLSARQTFV